MSAVLMTLFAVSIAGALGMAVYGLRVLVGRWEQPRRLRHKAQLAAPQPVPAPPAPAPAPPMPAVTGGSSHGAPPPVWVAPMTAVPAPLLSPAGMATPPPITLPAGGIPPPPPAQRFMPPIPPSHAAPAASGPRPAPPAFVPTPSWTPPPRAPSPAPRASSPGSYQAAAAPEAPRLARGSIPPDFTAEELELDAALEAALDPDTDPGIPAAVQPQVTRGARFSVVRSSRR